MVATTKRELVKRIAKKTNQRQNIVKDIIQMFLDEIIEELGKGNRLEFREFGIFQTVVKKERQARNPRTGTPVTVPSKAAVHFKVGRKMKEAMRKIPSEKLLAIAREALNRPDSDDDEDDKEDSEKNEKGA